MIAVAGPFREATYSGPTEGIDYKAGNERYVFIVVRLPEEVVKL